MQIKISTRHGHVSQETQEKVTDKVKKLTRLSVLISALNVTLDLAHEDDPIVEIIVNVDHHDEFVAKDQAGSLWASLDLCLDKISEQLRRYKDRLRDHAKPAHKRVEPPESPELKTPDVP